MWQPAACPGLRRDTVQMTENTQGPERLHVSRSKYSRAPEQDTASAKVGETPSLRVTPRFPGNHSPLQTASGRPLAEPTGSAVPAVRVRPSPVSHGLH